MGEIIFKTELIKGAKGDRGEAGQADSIPTDGVIAFQGETVPDGYEETDPGDVFDEVYEDINAVKDMIADEYDTTATYNAGDYCTHENGLYKCTATTTGLWDSSKWVLTSAGDETKANAAAIEVITENGCCNILPYTVQSTASATVVFTVNNGGSVTVNGTPTSSYPYTTYASFTLKAGTYILDSGVPAQSSVYVNLKDSGGNAIANTYDGKKEFTLATDTAVVAYIYLHALESVSNFTIYPMLYDARLNPTGYIQYSMTNRELTERVVQQIYQVQTVEIAPLGYNNSLCQNVTPPSSEYKLLSFIVDARGTYGTYLLWNYEPGNSRFTASNAHSSESATTNYTTITVYWIRI